MSESNGDVRRWEAMHQWKKAQMLWALSGIM
jgi:hypothetical protein